MTGHLFERRYRARLIETDRYFLTVLRYIHLNPVAAGIVAAPDHYQWSSHEVYLDTEAVPWITTGFGLSLFGQRVPVSLLPAIAHALAVSVEALIGQKDTKPAKRGPAPKLFQQMERIQHLPKARQRFVMQMLDTVLAQQDR